MTTPEIPVLCSCSRPADPVLVSLANTFPRTAGPPLCHACAARTESVAEKEYRAARKRQDHEDAQARFIAAIPPEMRETCTTRPDFNAALYNQISAWLPGSRWLGIIGPPATCKTRCMSILARNLIFAGYHVSWTTACRIQSLIGILRHGTDTEKREASAQLRSYRSAPILFLDDFGKNTWSPIIESTIFDLIDHRKTHFLPVIWSANSTLDSILRSGELTQDRGGPLLGRLLEASLIVMA